LLELSAHKNKPNISKYKISGFNLDSKDISYGRSGSRFFVKRITVGHVPSSVWVTGIVVGSYSKKEWGKIKMMVENKLLVILYKKVAKHLRVPGRHY